MHIKRFLLILLACFLTGTLWAQSTSTSPYSRYGFGDINSSALTPYFSMGGLSIPIGEATQLNLSNPATLSHIAKNRPLLDIGMRGNFTKLTSASSDNLVHTFSLRNISMGIPVSKRWGTSFGLVPYSSVGYKISDVQQVEGIGDVEYLYEGSGGLNQVFVGNSYRIIDKDSVKLALGLNASYIFGTINKHRDAVFNSSSFFNTKVRNATIIGDALFDAGLHYEGYLKGNIRYAVGATISLPSELNAKQDILSQSYQGTGVFETIIDTIEFVDSLEGSITMPKKLGYGIAFEFRSKQGNVKNNRRSFLIGIQYQLQDWSAYKEVFGETTVEDVLKNSSQYSLGMQLIPVMITRQDASTTYFQKARYRMGFRYSKTYLQLSETQLDEYGISFGIGLPLMNSGSTSMLNIGCELGERGTIENSLIKEQFAKINIGFSLSPHWKHDVWFRKIKYD
jgi:hypothetical protein